MLSSGRTELIFERTIHDIVQLLKRWYSVREHNLMTVSVQNLYVIEKFIFCTFRGKYSTCNGESVV